MLARLALAILSLLIAQLTLGATNVSDLGVPAGLSAEQYDNQGNDLLNKDKYALSRKYFDAAIRLQPNRWTAYYNRATAYRIERNWKAAITDLNETIRLEPAFFLASWNRSLVYQMMGNYGAAIRDLDALARVTFEVGNVGELSLVLNQRAWLRATCPNAAFRDGKSAVADAKKACEMNKRKEAQFVDTLAASSAEAGDFEAAVRYQEEAINLKKTEPAPKDKKTAIASKGSLQAYEHRRELYKRHQPFRDSPAK